MKRIPLLILLLLVLAPFTYSQKDSAKVFYFYFSHKIEDSLSTTFKEQYRPLAVWIYNNSQNEYHIYSYRSCKPMKDLPTDVQYLGYGVVDFVIIKSKIIYIRCSVFRKYCDFIPK
jgi:hypothetical protein